MEDGGAYTADRAAALSGVPKSTVHYWARENILVPSVSVDRTKLWSFADLLELRAIDWLRKEKTQPQGPEIPASRMRQIRAARKRLREEFDIRLFQERSPTVAVTRAGEVVICPQGVQPHDVEGQYLKDYVDLIKPNDRALHLLVPRRTIRIVPGKLSGAPHVAATRVETQALHALTLSGYGLDEIRKLYPYLSEESINESIDLEEHLTGLALAA
jgi:uncharacterized protein (DUF433 family)